ncbi:hypothetical protein HDZ31DRAFT_64474 [Schizophyllum fasciatum]
MPQHGAPFTDQEWLAILKALDAALSTVVIFKAVRSDPSAVIRKKYTGELLPLVWDWMIFFFSYTKTHRDADQDLVTVAKTKYKYDIFLGRKSLDGVLMWADLILYVLVGFPEGAPALRAIPDWAQTVYDVWKASTRTNYTNCDLTINISCSIEGSLLPLCTHHEGMRTDLSIAIASRGSPAGRALARRMRALIDGSPASTFRDLAAFVRLLRLLTPDKPVRLSFRPLLWLLAPAIRQVDTPEAEVCAMIYCGAKGQDMREELMSNCLLVLNDLRVGLHGTRDIIRLFRTGFLLAMYQTLERFPGGEAAKYVDDTLIDLVQPAMVFPSVLKAMATLFTRDSISPRVSKLTGFSGWNAMGALFVERRETMIQLEKTVKQLRFCHNEKHRTTCCIIKLPEDPLHTTSRFSDWYFVRHVARADARTALPACKANRNDRASHDVLVNYTGLCAESKKVEWITGREGVSAICVMAEVALGAMLTTMSFGAAGLGCGVQ